MNWNYFYIFVKEIFTTRKYSSIQRNIDIDSMDEKVKRKLLCTFDDDNDAKTEGDAMLLFSDMFQDVSIENKGSRTNDILIEGAKLDREYNGVIYITKNHNTNEIKIIDGDD